MSRCSFCDAPAVWTSPTGHNVCKECRKSMPSPTGLADLLDGVDTWLRRFVVFPNAHGSVAVTLWIAVTHIVGTLDIAPYLLVTAPEIESGKTRVMEIAATLCHKPMFSSSMTAAVLFRTIDRDHPTLLLDEADNTWTGRKDDKASELVALLNAGHRRGVPAQRMGGASKTVLQEFDVFGPKAIAGAFPDVGAIPEALRSRSIHLRMKRKLPAEKVERWTRQTREKNQGLINEHRDKLAAALNEADIAGVHVEPIEDLSDRDFDIWEPLLCIAARAGGRWPSAALDAAVALCAPDPGQSVPFRIQAVRDLHEVWNGAAHMLTTDLLDLLHKLPERPWADFYGSPLTPHRLGQFLGAYGVESKYEPGEKRRKGYYRQDLEDLWARYPSTLSQSSQTSPPSESEGLESIESLLTEKHEPTPEDIAP